MEGSAHSGPPQDKTYPILSLHLVLLSLPGVIANPHIPPPRERWELTSTLDGHLIAETFALGTIPSLEFDLCHLLGKDWDNWKGHEGSHLRGGALPVPRGYGCGHINLEKGLWHTQLIFGPPPDPLTAEGKDDFYCTAWGCETLAPWKTVDQEISFKREIRSGAPDKSGTCDIGDCNPVTLTIRSTTDRAWQARKTWGLRLFVSGHDPGVRFTLQKKVISPPVNPVGPLRPIIVPPQVLPPQPSHPHPSTPSVPLLSSLAPSPPAKDAPGPRPWVTPLSQTIDT